MTLHYYNWKAVMREHRPIEHGGIQLLIMALVAAIITAFVSILTQIPWYLCGLVIYAALGLIWPILFGRSIRVWLLDYWTRNVRAPYATFTNEYASYGPPLKLEIIRNRPNLNGTGPNRTSISFRIGGWFGRRLLTSGQRHQAWKITKIRRDSDRSLQAIQIMDNRGDRLTLSVEDAVNILLVVAPGDSSWQQIGNRMIHNYIQLERFQTPDERFTASLPKTNDG